MRDKKDRLKNPVSTGSGFTLIETVVVILIAGVFLGLASTSSKAVNRHKLSIAALMAAEDIRLTQQLSLNQNGIYAILFDCYNEMYYIRKCEAGVPAYKKVALPAGINLVATNFDFDNTDRRGLIDNELRFNSRGEPFRKNNFPGNGHLSLCDKNKNYLYVIVDVAGRVRIDTKPP